MLLGELISQFDNEAVATETILRVGDLALITAMRRNAEARGLTLGAYAAQAVQHYADTASDAEWTTLIGIMGRTADPGAACLSRVFARVV